MKNYIFTDGMKHTISISPFLITFLINIFGIPHLGARFRQKLLKTILIQANLPKQSHALDVGCGYGFNSILLSQHGLDVTSIDTNPKRLLIAKKMATKLKQKIVFKKASVYQLPFLSNSFDFCIFLEVIEHLQFPEKALSEISRILKPKGLLIMSYPSKPLHLDMHMLLGHIHTEFSTRKLNLLALNSAFRIRTNSTYGKTIIGHIVLRLNFYAMHISVILSGILSPIFELLLFLDYYMPLSGNPVGGMVTLEKVSKSKVRS